MGIRPSERVAVSCALVLLACAQPPRDAEEGIDAPTAAAALDAAASAPTLQAIMQRLAQDMDEVSAGLWADDLPRVAAAARSIADHPTVGEEERQRIFAVLGEAAAGFRQHDMRVHDLAVRLESEAAAGRLDRVLGTVAELQAGCVGCHTAHRDTLLAGRANGR